MPHIILAVTTAEPIDKNDPSCRGQEVRARESRGSCCCSKGTCHDALKVQCLLGLLFKVLAIMFHLLLAESECALQDDSCMGLLPPMVLSASRVSSCQQKGQGVLGAVTGNS